MPDALRIERFEAHDFRNLAAEPVALAPGGQLFFGDNGEGKTNCLEAIAVLSNLRSFRSSSFRRMARHGCASFTLSGEYSCAGRAGRLAQVVHIGPPLTRVLSVDGQPADVGTYLSRAPVFAIGPEDSALVCGSPEHRRAFVDRLAFLLDDRYLNELRNYRHLLRQRNAALSAAASDDELSAWEQQLATAAATVWRRRHAAVSSLIPFFDTIYGELKGESFPHLSFSYRGEGWSQVSDENLEQTYCQRYNETRARDRRVGFTLEGPHRHDLALRVGERSVRDLLSAGQTKIVAAALRLATLVQVERARGEILPLIVDDVDAALDATRVSGLVQWLGEERQVFLSSAHEGMKSLTRLARYQVHSGRCRHEVESGDTGP